LKLSALVERGKADRQENLCILLVEYSVSRES
jgi:hypothetical protein